MNNINKKDNFDDTIFKYDDVEDTQKKDKALEEPSWKVIIVDDEPAGKKNEQELNSPNKSIKILLAEDNSLMQTSISYFLEKNGYKVKIAPNGIQALEALKNESFDIILMDIQMPEMDGVETTKRIRTSKSGDFNPDIPIIALTAYAMKGDREKILKVGMDDYLSKPLNMDELIYKINSILKIKQKNSLKISSEKKFIRDINNFISELEGSESILITILQRFLKSADTIIKDMYKGIAENDQTKIARNAHSMTNAFSGILVYSTADLSKEIEKAAKDNNLDKCKALYYNLKDEMDKIFDYINDYLANNNS